MSATNENLNSPFRRPEGLTDAEFARFQKLALHYDVTQVEAELMHLLTHPETWVSAEQIRERMASIGSF